MTLKSKRGDHNDMEMRGKESYDESIQDDHPTHDDRDERFCQLEEWDSIAGLREGPEGYYIHVEVGLIQGYWYNLKLFETSLSRTLTQPY